MAENILNIEEELAVKDALRTYLAKYKNNLNLAFFKFNEVNNIPEEKRKGVLSIFGQKFLEGCDNLTKTLNTMSFGFTMDDLFMFIDIYLEIYKTKKNPLLFEDAILVINMISNHDRGYFSIYRICEYFFFDKKPHTLSIFEAKTDENVEFYKKKIKAFTNLEFPDFLFTVKMDWCPESILTKSEELRPALIISRKIDEWLRGRINKLRKDLFIHTRPLNEVGHAYPEHLDSDAQKTTFLELYRLDSMLKIFHSDFNQHFDWDLNSFLK